MNTEMTLFKRGIRKLDSLRPPQRDTLDAFEVFGRIADTCYFDEYGILCFENKEDRVNEEFLRLAFGKDVHVSNEEEVDSDDNVHTDKEEVRSSNEEENEESASFVVS